MSSEPEKLAEGTLISHLLELRDRLLRALVAVGLAFVPCVLNANALFTFLSRPLLEKLPPAAISSPRASCPPSPRPSSSPSSPR